MLKIINLLLLPLLLFGAYVENLQWRNDESFLMFLERVQLPQKLYYDLDVDDQTLTEEIRSGVGYDILREDSQEIRQVSIPINEELQIHIYKNNKDEYKLDVIPIITETKREAFVLEIESSPYNDILKATGNIKLATIFVNAFKNSLNFRRDLQKGDKLVMVYDQMYRLGEDFSMPILQVAMIEMKGKRHFMYLNSDDKYYDENGAEIDGFLLANPVNGARISSTFSKKRYHPILKRYRAHLGIDYAAKSGTPVLSSGDGKVVEAAFNRGYGNVIKVAHNGGYVSLYAHLTSFKSGVRNGKVVKKGEVIGYVGSTGLSTGPHLHFGLYKDNVAVNPQSVIRVAMTALAKKEKEAFEKLKKGFKQTVALHIAANTKPKKFEDIPSSQNINLQTFEVTPKES